MRAGFNLYASLDCKCVQLNGKLIMKGSVNELYLTYMHQSLHRFPIFNNYRSLQTYWI